MKLSDFLDLNSTVFNPVRYYDGEFLIPCIDTEFKGNTILRDNSIVKGGKNLFAEYVKEEYLLPLYKILDSKAGHTFPYIIINKHDYEKNKSTKFYFVGYILENLHGMSVLSDEKKYKIFELQDIDKMKTYYRNLLNEQLYKYLLLKKNVKNPKFFELKQLAMKDYTFYCNRIAQQITFEQFLSIRTNEIKKEMKSLNKLFDFFSKKINTEKFIECFDFDTLALIIAYTSVVQCETHLEMLGNQVDYCLIFCDYYIHAIENLRKNGVEKYNHTIVIDKKTGESIDTNTVLMRYKKIRNEHPEYILIDLTGENIEKILKKANKTTFLHGDMDISTEEGSKILDEAIRTILEQKALKASWKLIPKGDTKARADKIISKIHTEISDQEAARRVEYSYKFFEPNADIQDNDARRCKYNYIYSLQGVGGFEGYTAYVYPTGKVVFEIYFEDEKTFKPLKYHATYVTDLYHFVELSKLPKQKVTEKMRKDSRLGKRLYHRTDMDKWASDIERSLGSMDYTDDVVAYINSLIQSGELTAPNLTKNKR